MSGIRNSPYIIDETAGDKWYCRCGQSATQPYCDGSHKGSGFSPIKVTVEAGRVAWCGCRRSGKLPFCDGSHRS